MCSLVVGVLRSLGRVCIGDCGRTCLERPTETRVKVGTKLDMVSKRREKYHIYGIIFPA